MLALKTVHPRHGVTSLSVELAVIPEAPSIPRPVLAGLRASQRTGYGCSVQVAEVTVQMAMLLVAEGSSIDRLVKGVTNPPFIRSLLCAS